jgi:AraC-like DNA-binding protein
MHQGEDDSASPIRQSWLSTMVTASQRIACLAPSVAVDDIIGTLTSFVASVPDPVCHLEGLLFRTMLWDVAARFGQTVHDRVHHGTGRSCAFVPGARLACMSQPDRDPRSAFIDWAERYQRDLLRAHPITAAAKAARLIRDDYQRSWTIESLAVRVHATPSQLRRGFQREFGASIREYQRSLRLIAALQHVPHAKIDSIALQVGYRSKKNFYQAFQHVIGLTPTAFRRLSEQQAAAVIESLAHRRWPQ